MKRCKFCDTHIRQYEGRWLAVKSRVMNPEHCHYSAKTGASVGHEPPEGA